MDQTVEYTLHSYQSCSSYVSVNLQLLDYYLVYMYRFLYVIVCTHSNEHDNDH